ncbi:unnamed protein product [Cuscuta europaea]|uniref:Uncharacterized protein n=1 Tax=Cuscuta europaea TaxID=41803 RepID=A0A9P1ENE1_CUSEU|nr:unnamed protein product [Cuscuta europaea]
MENKEIAIFKTVKGQHACYAAKILEEEVYVYILEQLTQNIHEMRQFSESDFMAYLNNVKETGFLDDALLEPMGMSLDAIDSSGKRKHDVGPGESASSGSVAKK